MPTQTRFRWLLQARRVGKLISRYWFLTAPTYCFALQRAGVLRSTFYCPSARRSDNLPLKLSLSLLLSFPVQQLICHPFFLNVAASGFLSTFAAVVRARSEGTPFPRPLPPHHQAEAEVVSSSEAGAGVRLRREDDAALIASTSRL